MNLPIFLYILTLFFELSSGKSIKTDCLSISTAGQKILVGFVSEVKNASTFEECTAECKETSNCKSGMFYSNFTDYNCVLNFESGKSEPELLIDEKIDDVIYFEFIDLCHENELRLDESSISESNVAENLLLDKDCDEFKTIENKILIGFANSFLTAKSLNECRKNCIESKNKFGMECLSGMFYQGIDDNCILNGKAASELPEMLVDSNENVTYFEVQKCSNFTKSEECFKQDQNKILVGFAEVVATSENLEGCVNECRASNEKHGFECKSGNFFPKEPTSNCVLNTENAEIEPDLFGTSELEFTIYFEPHC